MRTIKVRKNLRLESFLGKTLYLQLCIMTASIRPKKSTKLTYQIFLRIYFFKEGKFKVKRAENKIPRDNVKPSSPISLCREVLRDKFLSSETAVFFTVGWLTCSIFRILGRPFAFWTTVWATANGICYKACDNSVSLPWMYSLTKECSRFSTSI